MTKKKKAWIEEEDMLVRISALIDRLIMTGDAEFRNTDLELLRVLERYLCDQCVFNRLQT